MGLTDPTLSKNKELILQNVGQLGTYVRDFLNFKCVLQMFI